jgi:hypothetical protein
MKRKLPFVLTFLAASAVLAVDVVCPQSDPAVKFAAKDLARILSGVEGRIETKIDSSMPAQEWRFKSPGDGTLSIYGRDSMALAYGIYAFLEEYAGCRWYAYDTECIPDLKGWKIPEIDASRRPAILNREMYVASDYMDGYWRLRNKETMRAAFAAGVSVGAPFACHTFAFYAKAVTNDALKAIGIDGKINGDDLCMTKKEVREIVAAKMIEYIKSDRKKKVPDGREYLYPTIYELSQNDGGSAGCRCKDCSEFCKREGSWAGPNIDFVNGVAEIVEKEFPEITVRTFAYSYTELPPKTIRARDNVQVRFCRSFVFSPLVKGNYNGNLLESWDAFAKYKSVWAYWRQFSGGLFPMVKSRSDIEREMRFCRDRGVTGYFAEDEHPLSRSFGIMQDWLFLKLADNPSLEIGKLSDEFLKAYYGKAAGIMDEYLTYLENRQASLYKRLDMDYVNRMNSGDMAQYVVIDDFPDREFFEKTDRWFDKAEKILSDAGDEKSLRHVREERAIADRAVFDFWPRLEKQGYKTDLKAKAAKYGATKKLQTEIFFKSGRGAYVDKEREERLPQLENEAGYLKNFPLPTPKEFDGARDVVALNWNNCGTAGKAVADPDAPGGYAMEIKAKAAKEVVFGYYQSARKIMGEELKVASTDGYRLFLLAKDMEMISPHYVYLNGWGVRTWIPSIGLPPEKRDVWINAKILPGGTMRFDRIFLVKKK